jgi:hypothetical protein
MVNTPLSDISELEGIERNKLRISSNSTRHVISMDTSSDKVVNQINELRKELIAT